MTRRHGGTGGRTVRDHMHRHGVIVAITLLAAACTRGEPMPAPPTTAPPPGAGLPGHEPVIRVGVVVDSATSGVSATARFTIEAPGGDIIARGAPGETFVFRNDGGRLVARSERGTTIGPQRGLLRVRAANDTVRLGGRAYRGEALVQTTDEGVSAINVVDLEAYLLGVVPREMGHRPASEIEALKAQAVAARTYAIGNLNGRSSHGFDFFATVADQVYGGVADEDSIVSRAVRETRGEIITHNGRPIIAYYSSTCGGRTASIEDSWPWGPSQPYLRSVSDRIPGTDDHYCDTSSRFHWDNEWTRPELLAVLGETLRAYTDGAVQRVDNVRDVRLADTNASGRAVVEIDADGRTYTVRADSVRRILLTEADGPILNSSLLFDIEAEHDDDGTVSRLHVSGGGWGHAIGMCQVGAMGRARAGQSYHEILTAYYTGVDIQRLY